MSSGGAYDAIVVGGGHNGLVCGGYLARAGRRTLILERRSVVGGAAATDELLPGVRVPTLAHTVGRLDPRVVRDLRLAEHGLSLVQPQVRAFAPALDGPGIVLWGDPRRTAASLAEDSPADSQAYPLFDRQVRSFGRVLARLARTTPPDLRQPSLGDALTGLELGIGFRGLGAADARSLLRILPMSVADLIGEWFESGRLRALLALRGVLYTASGPRYAGTAAVLLGDSAGNGGGAAGQTVFARGGPGAVSEALAEAARSAGAEIRTSSEVARILDHRGRARGVVLASGEEIEAATVVSGLDPRQTLLRLVDPSALGPTLRWRAGNIRARGAVAKVNLVLRELPRFGAADAPGGDPRLRGRIVIAPGMEALDRAADDAKYGRLSEAPILEATIPTLVDPTLIDADRAGDARHVLSVVVQYAPYVLRGTSWDDLRDPLGDAAISALEALSPGLAGSVLHRQVLTPLDLEREYGLPQGHPMHAEPGLDQWFAWRPLLGHARYRLGLERLYLCGSGAHPGGGVTGLPGANAARTILRERR